SIPNLRILSSSCRPTYSMSAMVVPPLPLLGTVSRQYTIARANGSTRKGPELGERGRQACTELGELVEPLGFDSIWATEHYGSAYSMQPNPLQYLAYWAGRTRRVDVGTAVIVAPWWNPVRLASEISMLDILLKGRRLHLGI